MSHPALTRDAVAVVTGGAAGIGLACAQEFAARGMHIAIADVRDQLLADAEATLSAAGAPRVLARRVDVSDADAVGEFADEVTAQLGGVDVLMANAGTQPGSALFGPGAAWERVIGVNLWGTIHTVRAFAPGMIARARPGAIVCTGSKQGITTPPGDPAYNVSKAGLKVFAEALAHELRNTPGCRVSAHLLIPGFVFTDLTRRERTENPAGAWTPGQTAAFMMERLAAGDFYILCPDNDVPRALDEKRMAWAIGDLIENRPALSRWHPDWEERFRAFVEGP